jgi:hypothetical protein
MAQGKTCLKLDRPSLAIGWILKWPEQTEAFSH